MRRGPTRLDDISFIAQVFDVTRCENIGWVVGDIRYSFVELLERGPASLFW